MMKHLIIVLMSSLIIFSCSNENAHTDSIPVTGKIKNTTAKKVYLEEMPVGGLQPMVVDSADIDKDGKFTLKAPTGESVILNLHLDQSTFPILSFVNEGKKIDLDINMGTTNNQFVEKYEISGSPSSLLMRDYIIKSTKYLQEIYFEAMAADSLRKTNSGDSLVQLRLAGKREKGVEFRKYALSAAEKAVDPALAVFQLSYYLQAAGNPAYELQPVKDEEIASLLKGISTRFPKHIALTALKQSMDSVVQAKLTGKPAPGFTLPDPSGKEISLGSFKGKYVLVDFWASWCGPCRAENPSVVKAYQRFKNKNFTILGVSLDKTKSAWLEAVAKDQLTWTHVSDLQYWSSPIVETYGISSIPYNILIDPQGNIIDEGLHGPALEARLEQLLK